MMLETYQMKSLQWQQKVGCLKNRGMNLWSFTCNPLFTWQLGQYPVVIFANRHAKSACISTMQIFQKFWNKKYESTVLEKSISKKYWDQYSLSINKKSQRRVNQSHLTDVLLLECSLPGSEPRDVDHPVTLALHLRRLGHPAFNIL